MRQVSRIRSTILIFVQTGVPLLRGAPRARRDQACRCDHRSRRAGSGTGMFKAVAPTPAPFSHVLGGTVPIPRVEGRSAAQNM